MSSLRRMHLRCSILLLFSNQQTGLPTSWHMMMSSLHSCCWGRTTQERLRFLRGLLWDSQIVLMWLSGRVTYVWWRKIVWWKEKGKPSPFPVALCPLWVFRLLASFQGWRITYFARSQRFLKQKGLLSLEERTTNNLSKRVSWSRMTLSGGQWTPNFTLTFPFNPITLELRLLWGSQSWPSWSSWCGRTDGEGRGMYCYVISYFSLIHN